MHHLTLEDLARLVDEAPAEQEARHLRDCLVCRRELDALREQTTALAELLPLEPAAGAWTALESRLLDEGLVRNSVPTRRIFWPSPMLRAAAAVALFLAGGVLGATLWDRGTPGEVAQGPAPQLPPAEPALLPDRRLAGTLETESPATAPAAAPVVLAANSPGTPAPAARRPRPPARTPAVRRAERALAEAEESYLAALQRYAELADPASGGDPAVRLEALDRLVEMSARALDRSPDDARLNGYHLAALNERDALRRRIQRAAQTTWF